MKIVKRLLLLLFALILCTGYANAEEYVTLAQLRKQAAEGWNETYEAMGREVVADVEMGWIQRIQTYIYQPIDTGGSI